MGRADLKILDRMTGGETTGGEAEEPEPCLQAAFPQLVWVFLSNTLSSVVGTRVTLCRHIACTCEGLLHQARMLILGWSGGGRPLALGLMNFEWSHWCFYSQLWLWLV